MFFSVLLVFFLGNHSTSLTKQFEISFGRTEQFMNLHWSEQKNNTGIHVQGEWKGEKIAGDFPLGKGQFSCIFKWVKFCSISWVDGGYFEKSRMKTEQTASCLGPIFLMLHFF